MKKEIAIPIFVLATIASIVFVSSNTTWLGNRFYERPHTEKVSEDAVPGKGRLILFVSKIFIGVEKLDEDQYSVRLMWENGNATTPFSQSEEFIAFRIPRPLISPELSVVFRDGRQKIVPLEIDY